MSQAAPDPLHDFDFLHGRWTVRHRSLASRLTGSDDWREFEGHTVCRPVMGGLANLEENVFPARGAAGAAFRSLDLETGEWTILWVDSRSGRIDPPMRGRFEPGPDGPVGTFLGEDTVNGAPVRVRFLWHRITPVSARWEQAFSADGGESWETNWVMDFSRTGF